MNEKGRKLNELCMGKKLSWGKYAFREEGYPYIYMGEWSGWS